MYLEKAHEKVIGTQYGRGPKEKDKKGIIERFIGKGGVKIR